MILTIDNKDYELAITTKMALRMEETLGNNPINVILRMAASEELPKLNDLLVIFHGALQKYNHGISFESAVDLFDRYLDNGGSVTDFIEIVLKVFIESGLIKLDEEQKNLLAGM